MTIKIIYNYDGDDAVVEKPKLNIEIALQKTFTICSKVIDACDYVMDHLDIKDLYENYTETDMFKEKMTDKDRLMHVFSLICGQKVNVLQAIAYATIILRRIKDIADSAGMEIAPDREEKYKVEYMSDREAIIIGDMIRNLGMDYVRDFAAQTRDDIGIFDSEARCRNYYQDKIDDIKLKKLSVPELASTFGTFTPDNSVNVDEVSKKLENKIGNPKDSEVNQKHHEIILECRPKVEDKEEKTAFSEYKKAYEQFKEQSEQDELSQTIGHVKLTEEEMKEFNNLMGKLEKEKQGGAKKLQKSLMRWNRKKEIGKHRFDSS